MGHQQNKEIIKVIEEGQDIYIQLKQEEKLQLKP